VMMVILVVCCSIVHPTNAWDCVHQSLTTSILPARQLVDMRPYDVSALTDGSVSAEEPDV